MDLLYTVTRKHCGKTQFYNDFMDVEDEIKGLIRVSPNNIVAWITKYELNDPGDLSLGSRVYVADLNIPWTFHKITTHGGMITLLEWDLSGENLLIGDDSGTVSIWSFSEYIFNDWTCVGNVNLLGEYMIAGIFFHSGRKLALNAEKDVGVNYYDKFSYVRYTPTIQMAGGTSMDGCLVITTTGLAVANLITNDGSSSLVSSTESLCPVRYKISVVDIAYGKNGTLIVATSCGNYKMPIKCYEVSVKYTAKKICSISSQPLAGFFLDSSALENSGSDWYIARIRFLVRDIVDSLIVVVNGSAGSVVQLWNISENSTVMSHMFNEATINSNVVKPLNWKCLGSYSNSSQVISLASPKTLMSNLHNAACYITVAYRDHKIRALSRSLKEEISFNIDIHWDVRSFSNICIADVDLSWLANVLLVVDSAGNLYVMQMQNAELGGPINVPYAVTMLEYCLVSGLDFWDIAISLRPPKLEAVCDRFNENFTKQLPSVQQLEYGGFLSMKAFLYRLAGNSSQKHSDLMSLLTLHSISIAFKSLLRPSDLSSSDKGPGETLTAILSEPLHADINNVIMNIEAKEYSVDPNMLLSLQQLIQWVTHLALNILARVPDHHRSTSGYDIINDNHALNILRELLVVIRIWGFMKQSLLPVFLRSGTFDGISARSGNFDGLSTIFRLLSRLVHCNQNNELDETLIDDCYLLRNQVLFPTLTLTTVEICDVASPAFHRQSLPLRFTFGMEPESIVCEMEMFTIDGSIRTVQNTDIIRHVYLGDNHSNKVKQCNRCQGKTQATVAGRSPAIRSWENRWIRSCLCGGRWRFIKSTKSPYVK